MVCPHNESCLREIGRLGVAGLEKRIQQGVLWLSRVRRSPGTAALTTATQAAVWEPTRRITEKFCFGTLKTVGEVSQYSGFGEVWRVLTAGGNSVGRTAAPSFWPSKAGGNKRGRGVDAGLDLSEEISSAENLTRLRSRRSSWMPPEDVRYCWESSLLERDGGWLRGPFTLDEAAALGAEILLTRFAHHETEKIRLCDNGIPLNVVSAMATGIPLPSVSHALALSASWAEMFRERPLTDAHGPRAPCTCFWRDVRSFSGRQDEARDPLNCEKYTFAAFPGDAHDLSPPDLGAQVDAILGHLPDFGPDPDTGSWSEEESLVQWIVDVANAYKNVAISPEGARTNWIAVFDPTDPTPQYKAFQGLTLLFGNLHSVTEWIIIGQFLAFAVRWLFGLPLVIYIDDMTGPIFGCLRRLALRAIVFMLETFGFPWKLKKVRSGVRDFTVLGLDFNTLERRPCMRLSAARAEALASSLRSVLESGTLSPAAASKLSGKFLFPFSLAVGRRINGLLKPLFRRAAMTDRRATALPLSALTRSTLEFMADAVPLLPPVCYRHLSLPVVLSYTDASWKRGAGWLGGIRVRDSSLEAFRLRLSRADFGDASWGSFPINVLEALAPVLLLLLWGPALSHSRLVLVLDNSTAFSVLRNCSGNRGHLSLVAALFWSLCARFGITPYLELLPSRENIADATTREALWTALCAHTSVVETPTEDLGASVRALLLRLVTYVEAPGEIFADPLFTDFLAVA
eukprot:g7794.t1